MAWTTRELAWLAGLLEGEGHFSYHAGAPGIALNMTDRDVVEAAGRMLGVRRVWAWQPKDGCLGRKTQFRVRRSGVAAVAWMMTLFLFFGCRRREQVRRVLAEWRLRGVLNAHKTRCKRGHALSGSNVRSRSAQRRHRICRACIRGLYAKNRDRLNARRRARRAEAL